MRRTAVLATVITTAGLAAAAALASTGAAHAPSGAAQEAGPPTGTKQLVMRQVSFKFLDHPPLRPGDVPPSPGDTAFIGYRVFDAASKARLGRLSAVCVSTDRRGEQVQCTGMMTLPDGEIVMQGPKSTLAITGGTGAYAGARGTAKSDDHGLTLTFMP